MSKRLPPWRIIVTRAVGSLLAAAATVWAEDALERCRLDPTALRQDRVYQQLELIDRQHRAELLRRLAADRLLPWDIRARAVTLLDRDDDRAAYQQFLDAFTAADAAGSDEGAEAILFLADWLLRHGSRSGALIEAELLPEGGVGPVLQRLAGRPMHAYLRLLHDRGEPIDPALVPALAETDDQDTRRFLCWYVGAQKLRNLQPFLVDQISSRRPSTYPSQAGRLFAAAFTIGMSEVIRSAAPPPEWLREEVSPKGLALSSLQRLLPEGRPLSDRTQVSRLLTAADRIAAAKDRADWTLATRILLFLHARGEQLGDRGEVVLEKVARQALRWRRPIRAFVLAEEVHRLTGLPLPRLSEEEQAKLWQETRKTLQPEFLLAMLRTFPDAEQQRQLEAHLIGLGAEAADGSLHMVRTWGSDIEGPGDWARCVSELGLVEAVADVERVLGTSWTKEAVEALLRFGARGAPALDRFLRTPAATRIDRQLLEAAVASCRSHLPADQVRSLLAHLRGDRYLCTLAGVASGV